MNPIDEAIAIKLFGWRWLAFDRYVVHFVPCRVRSISPLETNGYWNEYLTEANQHVCTYWVDTKRKVRVRTTEV